MMLDNLVSATRQKTFANSSQLTLGELIAKLEEIPMRDGKDGVCVQFDFEDARPDGVSSWRGAYNELAIEFSFEGEITLPNFLRMLKNAIGFTYEGYKGGDFVMGTHTPVWVANWGNSGSTGVVGVIDKGWRVIIETKYCEYADL